MQKRFGDISVPSPSLKRSRYGNIVKIAVPVHHKSRAWYRRSIWVKGVKANETDSDEVPHLTGHSGHGGICFDKFITKEKAAHGMVQVTHMVEDIYPKWSDAEKIDPLVKNIVEDIISGRLRANTLSEDEKNNKRKMDVEEKKMI